MNFWQKLQEEKKELSQQTGKCEPIFCIAPMADVTDPPFRKLFAQYGKPDVMWTEFVAADGLVHAPHIADPKKHPHGLSPYEMLARDLWFVEAERPIVAQLFTGQAQNMKKAARLAVELGFDGIDINMGCPDRSIEKQMSGSAMIKHPDNAIAVINGAFAGIAEAFASIENDAILQKVRMKQFPDAPHKIEDFALTIKTRLGYNVDQLEEWLPLLLQDFEYEFEHSDREGDSHIKTQIGRLSAVTLHARTRKEMSKVPAKWDRIARAVEIRDAVQAHLPESERALIIGNGDVTSLDDGRARCELSGADGVMIGRGIFGNPWFFNPNISRDTDIALTERLNVMLEHTKLFTELLPHKNFAVMKKHYKAYVDGFPQAKELRVALMETNNVQEVETVVQDFIAQNL